MWIGWHTGHVDQGQEWGARFGEYGQDVKDWLQCMVNLDSWDPYI